MWGQANKVNAVTEEVAPKLSAEEIARRAKLPADAREALEGADRRYAARLAQSIENTGEIGGPSGPEPTRYGDWERKGRVSDF